MYKPYGHFYLCSKCTLKLCVTMKHYFRFIVILLYKRVSHQHSLLHNHHAIIAKVRDIQCHTTKCIERAITQYGMYIYKIPYYRISQYVKLL